MDNDQTPFGDLGPAQPLSRRVVVPFEKPKKRVPAKTERLIGELGLRYRPSAQADLEEHAAALALLTRDVADVPPDLLERAIEEHVRTSHFMPKAAELINLARRKLQRDIGGETDRDSRANAERLAANANAVLAGQGKFNIRWIVDEQNALKIEAA